MDSSKQPGSYTAQICDGSADKFKVNPITATEWTNRLNTAYSLLEETVESDIRSAHDIQVCARPILPVYLDELYGRLIAAVELEGDVEAELITFGFVDM